MKNYIAVIMVAVLVASAAMITGCQLDDSQIKAIAQNAGLAAAVTWIAYDAPDDEAKDMVSSTLDIIKNNANEVKTGKTYMEVMYPKIEEFVRSDQVPDRYEPAVLAGAMASLNGLDLLFLTHPEWKEKEGLALDVVNAFVNGANTGLALSDKDPRIQQAKSMSTKRAKIYSK